ncbi:MAG: 50S ribosomal protein L10 [Planctomycetota bacterium]|jgi:large subunit ribosomal protein L10|nr:50S ribosomal protein L10 [Planctomycetota bacterium]
MPNRVNGLQVEQYKRTFKDVGFVIAVGYPKLDVKGIDQLRGKLIAAGGKMLFVRNRLAVIAMKELGHGNAAPICDGQSAFVWGEDPAAIARFLVDFKKDHAELLLHGALIEREVLDSGQVIELSKSPTREELKSIISGQIIAMGGKLSAQLLAAGGLVASQIEKIGKSDAGGEAA